MALTKIKKTCVVCEINLYEETGNRPDPKAMPCGIDRTDVPEITNEKERVRCPYETEEEQRNNARRNTFDPAGLGQIMYEGGIEI